MYLYKRSNGRYYIHYPQLNGKLTCISTKTKFKSEALKFLSKFSEELKERIDKKLNPIPLSKFFFDFLRYSESVHSWNHTLSLRITFKSFMKYCGNISLSDLTKEKLASFLRRD